MDEWNKHNSSMLSGVFFFLLLPPKGRYDLFLDFFFLVCIKNVYSLLRLIHNFNEREKNMKDWYRYNQVILFGKHSLYFLGYFSLSKLSAFCKCAVVDEDKTHNNDNGQCTKKASTKLSREKKNIAAAFNTFECDWWTDKGTQLVQTDSRCGMYST